MRITICDLCDDWEDVKAVFFPLDNPMDGAGSRQITGENIDLCPTCRLKMYLRAFADQKSNFEHNQKLVDAYKQLRKEKGRKSK
jgi:hypothetical protein